MHAEESAVGSCITRSTGRAKRALTHSEVIFGQWRSEALGAKGADVHARETAHAAKGADLQRSKPSMETVGVSWPEINLRAGQKIKLKA